MNIGMDDTIKKDKPKVGRKPKNKESEQKKNVIYYCIKGICSFSVPEYERDEFRQVITDSHDNKKMLMEFDVDGNNKHQVFKKYQFDRLPIIDKKTNKTDATKNYGQFVVHHEDDRYDDIIAAIEKIRLNPLNGIMNTEQFGKHENEAEYRQRVENNRLKDENKDLKSENDELREKLRKQGLDIS